MNFFYLITLLLFSTSIQANVKVNSIIKLRENIPEECGLNFSNKKEKFTAELTLKKNDTNLQDINELLDWLTNATERMNKVAKLLETK